MTMRTCVITREARDLMAVALSDFQALPSIHGGELAALAKMVELLRSPLVAFSVVVAPGGPDVGRL